MSALRVLRPLFLLSLVLLVGACGSDGSDGRDGSDGVSCTIVIEEDARFLRCDDGTELALPASGAADPGPTGVPGDPGDPGATGEPGVTGPAGVGCTVETDEATGRSRIVCDDGTEVEIPEGGSCSAEANLDGTVTIRCDDGTSADVGGPVRETDEDSLVLLAGVTSVGSNDGTGTETRMDGALHATFSPDGHFLYFVDSFNGTIRRYGLTSNRTVTLAGQPGIEGVDDGVGADALFENPRGITISPDGSTLYIADGFNCTLRTLDTRTREVRTLFGVPRGCAYVDGDFSEARMGLVIGMAVQDDRFVYMAQRGNGGQAIRRIDLEEERVETLAGGALNGFWEGAGHQALIASPGGIDFDASGEWLWFNDMTNNVIRRMSMTEQAVRPSVAFEASDDLIVDLFDVEVDEQELDADSVGELDENGQPGVQVPVLDAGILGGERDAQFWIGYVEASENGGNGGNGGESDPEEVWTFGVDEELGLFWEAGARAHVNMLLEWDGSGDGSTYGAALPDAELNEDLSDYAGLRVRFGSNSAPIEMQATLGARDEDTSPCGADCGFAVTSSSSPVVTAHGRHGGAFEVYLPFADFEVTHPHLGVAPMDLAEVTLISLRITSAEETTGNALELRSVSLVREDEVALANTWRVETVAGTPRMGGHVDGDGPDARFSISQGLTRGVDGFYVAGFHDTIRRISPEPPYTVTTVAGRSGESGSRDGQALDARFGVAFGIHAHPDGERIYYMDRGSNNIREFNTTLGRVTTVMGAPRPDDWVDGDFGAARFRVPVGMAQTADGRFLYVADQYNHVVRRMDLASRRIETLAGMPVTAGFTDGIADDARLSHPFALALNAAEDRLYVSTFARSPSAVGNRAVRVLNLDTLEVTTLAGGPDRLLTFDSDGGLSESNVLEGPLADTHWGESSGLALDDARSLLYVSDINARRVRVIDLEAGSVRTLAGGALPPMVQAVDEHGDPVEDEHGEPVMEVAAEYEVDGTGEEAILSGPEGLALSRDGSVLYLAESTHHLVRRIDTQTGEVTTLAGEYGVSGAFDDIGLDAAFTQPMALTLTEDEGALLVVDRNNAAIRRLDLDTLEVTTVAGELGIRGGLGFSIVPLTLSRFYFPMGILRSGGDILLTDRNVVYRAEGLAAAEEGQ